LLVTGMLVGSERFLGWSGETLLVRLGLLGL